MLAEVDPGWFDGLDAALVARAKRSPLGQRMLARWLLQEHAQQLLSPMPTRDFGLIARDWPRSRVVWLVRDLGILAYAPAVRAEVRRDPVRRLRRLLGNSYMLALDRTVWDGRLEPVVERGLINALSAALDTPEHDDGAIWSLLETQGLQELRSWGMHAEPALGQWVKLMAPPLPEGPAYLPPESVRMLRDHHAARPLAA